MYLFGQSCAFQSKLVLALSPIDSSVDVCAE